MQLRPAKLPDYSDPLEIPKFLDMREFVEKDGQVYIVVKPTPDLYDPRGPRVWAPLKSASEIRRREEAPAAQLYCANHAWPVQIVSKGKRPQNLALHQDWDTFKKFHDFEDFPVERVFHGGDVTYVVVKNDSARNNIVNGAMQGVSLNKRPDLMEQNGVKRPRTGSITASAWAAYDDMHAKGTDFMEVFNRLKDAGMNPSTIRTQYSHWKRFNGISK